MNIRTSGYMYICIICLEVVFVMVVMVLEFVMVVVVASALLSQ